MYSNSPGYFSVTFVLLEQCAGVCLFSMLSQHLSCLSKKALLLDAKLLETNGIGRHQHWINKTLKNDIFHLCISDLFNTFPCWYTITLPKKTDIKSGQRKICSSTKSEYGN